MKRHAALQELSRDHHHALVAALRLKRAGEESAGAARDGFIAYWDAEGRGHFREEEEILLPACVDHIDVEAPVVARVLTDHVRIRHLAERVRAGASPVVMRELGERLERHIRHEERELFPLIERALPEDELAALVQALRR